MNAKLGTIGTLTCLLLVGLSASTAYALDMEYYTYNGFDAVVGAFQKIVLIFSDNGYRTLFFSVIVLGILFGGMSVFAKAAMGARTSALAWAWPVGIGVVLYLALIIPRGNLIVYDPIKNRTQTIGNMPEGIVVVAGMLNRIERGLVDIVSTSADPMSFQEQAGGVGFDMLSNISTNGLAYDDQYLNASLIRYIEDCVLFELQRPGTTLTVQSMSKNTDAMAEFAKAQHPSNYTTFYTETNPEGTTMTCTDAWTNNILPALNDATKYDTVTQARCADAGYDPTIPAEYTRCKENLENTMQWIQGAAYTTVQIYRQFILTNYFNDIIISKSPDTAVAVLASRNTGTSMLSSTVVANQWLPIMRAVVTAIAIGMIPFMVIFIPTPLYSKAIGIICGFFVWLTAWGVTDAVVHSFAIDYAHKAFDEIARYELGVVSITNFGTSALKTMAAFGAIRWSGLMMATVITGMLVKFGGHALAQLSGNITSPAQHGGSSAGMDVVTPEGASSKLSALEKAAATMEYVHRGPSFMHRARAQAMQMVGKARGNADIMEEMGFDGGANAVAGHQKMMATRGAGYNRASTKIGGTEATVAAETGRQFGGMVEGKASGEVIDKMGKDVVGQASAFKKETGVLTTGEHKKIYGDAATQARTTTARESVLKGMADREGTSVDQLARNLSTMDYGRSVETMAKYAEERDVPFSQAAAELGEIGGSQQYTGARAFRDARGVVGEQGISWYKTQEMMNEAAKMDQTYRFANMLSDKPMDKNDFAGMYMYNKTHHGQESLTLEKGQADNLNKLLKREGIKHASFQKGDRVTIARTQDGKVTVAKGERGADSEAFDVTRSVKGWEKRNVGKTTDDFGYRGEFGTKRTEYNENTFQGVIDMAGPDGKPMRMHGVVQKDSKGNIVATALTNEQNSRVVTMVPVHTGRVGADGKPIYDNQWGVANVTRNKNGVPVLSDFRALSKREVMKNGYAASQIVEPSTGAVIMETAQRGQDVKDIDKFVLDRASEFKGTLSGSIAEIGGKDKTALSDGQVEAMIGLGALEKGADLFIKAKSIRGTGKPGEGKPSSNASNRNIWTKVGVGATATALATGPAVGMLALGNDNREELYRARNNLVAEQVALKGPDGQHRKEATESLNAYKAAGYYIYPDIDGKNVNVVHPVNRDKFTSIQDTINWIDESAGQGKVEDQTPGEGPAQQTIKKVITNDAVSNYMAQTRMDESGSAEISTGNVASTNSDGARDVFPGGTGKNIEGLAPTDVDRRPSSAANTGRGR